ncbi:MAG: hypothetical protein J7L46_06905, partial [Bacteroidales bacterium]|nr:hypothetical protein [Bacteroidales bacterium]
MNRYNSNNGQKWILSQRRNLPQRRSIRLKGYDYSQAGLYFITICVKNRIYLFGEIDNGKMILNNAGKMVEKLWNEISNDFTNTKLHEYIIMPNHFHGIIEIVGADSISARDNADSTKRAEIDSAPTATETKTAIPNIIQSFKRHTTIKYIRGVKNNNWTPFNKKLWQRNYWEHIIRNEKSYQTISEY